MPRKKKLCAETEVSDSVKVPTSDDNESPIAGNEEKGGRLKKLHSRAASSTASGLSPARKLRKQVNQNTAKVDVVVDENVRDEEMEHKGEIKSKYFGGEGVAASSKSSSGRKTAGHGCNRTTARKEASSKGAVVNQKNRGRRKKVEDLDQGEDDDNMDTEKQKRAPRSNRKQQTEEQGDKKIEKQKGRQTEKRPRSQANKQTDEPVGKRKSLPSKRSKRDDSGKNIIQQKGKKQAEETKEVESNENAAEESDSDSESEWEEVEELKVEDDAWKSQIPDKPVQITLQGTDLINPKRKRGNVDINDIFRRQLNRFRTETQENAHKVHLLCLLSHGQFKNFVCCSTLLKSIALSLVPEEFTNRSHDKWTLNFLTKFVNWFKKTILVEECEENGTQKMDEALLVRFSERKATSEHEFILMFTISCRVIGLLTRLICSLQPITFKPSDLKKTKTAKNASESNKNVKASKSQEKKKTSCSVPGVVVSLDSSDSVSGLEMADGGSQSSSARSSTNQLQMDDSSQSQTLAGSNKTVAKTKNCRPRRRGSKVNYNEADGESESEKEADISKSIDSSEDLKSEKTDSKRNKRQHSSSDDDFEEQKIAFRRSSKHSMKRVANARSKRKSIDIKISDEDRFVIVSKTSGCDWWTEVYLEEEKKWVCVNGCQLLLNHPESAEQQATKPLSYILAYDEDGSIKDVTKKYASDWMSSLKKVRVDDPWWKDVLAPFEKQGSERDAKEDADVQEKLLKKPLPTSISDFKNHPLYALKRHLLKFEGLHPPDAPVLGHIRGEPVYSRSCVHTLHAREKWRLEGRLVRIDEVPVKIVRARPKWNKPKEFNDRLMLQLFGIWQTEPYMPAPAVDGKVPKNDYGNVEVFQPWMVPAGTIHLPDTLNGLGRVAKKMNIDVAPAMVGWDFHGGFNHPILQGWIVCEEFKDVLLAAWEEDQAIQRQKEADKKQQRVLNNWKTLIKGLLIRERLKRRFDLEEPEKFHKKSKKGDLNDGDCDSEDGDEAKQSGTTACWPENLKTKQGYDTFETKHNLFPFEKDPV